MYFSPLEPPDPEFEKSQTGKFKFSGRCSFHDVDQTRRSPRGDHERRRVIFDLN